jgi:hypothetical protein
MRAGNVKEKEKEKENRNSRGIALEKKTSKSTPEQVISLPGFVHIPLW